MTNEYYPIEEAAKFLHVTKWTVYRLVSSGKLKNVRFNARTQFFEREEIERYARANGYRIEIPDQAQGVTR